jgi:hypothetical protein
MARPHQLAPDVDRRVGSLAQTAQSELERIAQVSQTLRGQLVDLMAETTALRLEHHQLMAEVARHRRRLGFRLGTLPRRAWLALRRAVFPVGTVRRRALAVLASEGLLPDIAEHRLFFAPDYYRAQLPPDALGGDEPTRARLLRHYIRTGGAQGRKPTPLFDPTYYAAQVPGLKPGQARALVHFMEHGLRLGHAPNASLTRIPLMAHAAGMTPAVWLVCHPC